MFAWTIFKHYLLSSRAGSLIRTIAWTSIFGMGLGVFSLVVVLSVMNGFNQSMNQRLLSVDPHLIYQFDKEKNESVENIESKIQKSLADFSGWRFNSFEQQDVILRSLSGAFDGAIARGLEAKELENLIHRVYQSQKKNITGPLKKIELLPGEVIIGAHLATSIGALEGDQIIVIPPESLLMTEGAPPFEKVTIRDILTTNIPEWDSRMILYNSNHSLKLFKNSPARETGYEIWLDDPYSFSSIQSELEQNDIKTSSWSQRNASLFFALKVERNLMSMFLTFAIIITSFSIITVLILLSSQKRKDIGIFLAMGMSNKRTGLVYAKLGAILTLLGAGSGLILGIIASLLLQAYPLEILPQIYYDRSIPVQFSLSVFVLVVVVVFLVTLIGAIVPARIVMKLNPSSALRG